MATNRGFRWDLLWLCLCGCFLWSLTADAATRRFPTMPSNQSVVKNGTPSRVGDTLTIGGPLEGEFIPLDYSGSKGTRLPARVRYDFSIPSTYKGYKGMLKANLLLLAGTVALDLLLDSIDGLIEGDDGGQPRIVRSSDELVYDTNGNFTWSAPFFTSTRFPSPNLACEYTAANQGRTLIGVSMRSDGSATCRYNNPNGTTSNYASPRYGTGCAVGTYKEVGGVYGCYEPRKTALTDSDIDNLDLSSFNDDFLQDILNDSCRGSLNPDGCLESLKESQSLSGPSTLTGPTTTTTSTYTRPDGTTGEVVTTTNNNYKITYGPNYYDYSRSSTTTKTEDGVVTETTEDSESDDVTEEDVAESPKPCADDCDGPAYEDLYTPTEDTKESLLDSYMTRVQQIPLFTAVGGFFDVSVSGSCPVWQADLDMDLLGNVFAYQFVFDFHCQPWFVDLRPFCLVVFMIFGAGIAFRIALL